MHIFRVTVRGHFADLGPELREQLLAAAEDHSVFRSAFAADGTFSYEPNLVAFNHRFEVRLRDGDEADPRAGAERIGRERAVAHLESAGIPYKHLRATVADMAEIWPA